jgi:hypothetical protein
MNLQMSKPTIALHTREHDGEERSAPLVVIGSLAVCLFVFVTAEFASKGVWRVATP